VIYSWFIYDLVAVFAIYSLICNLFAIYSQFLRFICDLVAIYLRLIRDLFAVCSRFNYLWIIHGFCDLIAGFAFYSRFIRDLFAVYLRFSRGFRNLLTIYLR
jgi:hypothetical protein